MDGIQGWHPGERAIQKKLDFDGPMSMAWTWIEHSMPEQHRVFHSRNLHFLPLSSVDAEGRPWGSILAAKDGNPGFIRSPTETSLDVSFRTWDGDPWTENYEAWRSHADEKFLVAGIGIELGTRRRNKLAGWATEVKQVGQNDYFVKLYVNQAIGNCPKYINIRELESYPETRPKVVYRHPHVGEQDRLPDELIQFIHDADTIYISSSYDAKPEHATKFPSHMGMNQRGGRPGFVRVRPSDGRTVIVPDFSGNRLLSSLGNIEYTRRAGLTIIEYTSGSILYLTGTATNLVGDAAVALMPRQKVLTAITVTGYTFVRDALPVRQRPGTAPIRSPYSPLIKLLREEMGEAGRLFDQESTTVLLRRIEILSPTLATFEWDVDGEKPLAIQPGQAAILDFSDFLGKPGYQHMAPLAPSSVNDDRIRTWTVSDSGTRSFALTMRLKPGGAVTGALFTIALKLAEMNPRVLADTRPLQLRVQLVGISGDFTLSAAASTEGMLWVAGGIGVTPFLAMLCALAQAGREVDVRLVLSTREPEVLIRLVLQTLGDVSALGIKLALDVFTNASKPAVQETRPHGVVVKYHGGRIGSSFWEGLDIDDIQRRTKYICGPVEFEEAVLASLYGDQGVHGWNFPCRASRDRIAGTPPAFSSLLCLFLRLSAPFYG